MYVSYTDIEIEYKPSDAEVTDSYEEVTDCVGKVKMHLKETRKWT